MPTPRTISGQAIANSVSDRNCSGANIQALTGGGSPDSGEIVVVAAGADGAIREVGRIPVSER